MRLITILVLVFLGIIGLQGCATTSNDNNISRHEIIASPAARISAGSGAMHTGMSRNY